MYLSLSLENTGQVWIDTIRNRNDSKVEEFKERARFVHRRSESITGDAMNAATATLHRLTVVTQNISDLGQLRTPLRGPFARD